MKLEEIHALAWSTARKYVFIAVCDDSIPENTRFARYTPSGRFEITIDNPPAQAQYELGQCYYFDSTPCVPPAEAVKLAA